MKTSERLKEFCEGETSLFYASEEVALDNDGVCQHIIPALLALVAAQHEALVDLVDRFGSAPKAAEAIAAHEKWEQGNV